MRTRYITGEVLENRAWTDRLFSLRIRAEQSGPLRQVSLFVYNCL